MSEDIILIAIGMAFIVVSVFLSRKHLRLLFTGCWVQAEVASYQESYSSNGGVKQSYVYEYELVDSHENRRMFGVDEYNGYSETKWASRLFKKNIGDKVMLIYNPNKPREFVRAFGLMNILFYTPAVVGAFLIYMASFVL